MRIVEFNLIHLFPRYEQMLMAPLIQVLPSGFLPTNCNPLPCRALMVRNSGWLSF